MSWNFWVKTGQKMPKKSPYEADFEKYIRHTGADKKEKTFAWATAIGLQQVDGLKPSEYLYQTAKRNIEGEISFDDVSRLINSYYKSKSFRLQNADNRTEEADKVSSRIAQILSEPSFNFSPSYLIAVHKRLFDGIFKFAGRLRDYDITKNEWVLNGDTVMYGAAFELKTALEYDFMQEKKFRYKNLSMDEIVRHITFFVSRLWQIHVFGEGNTRTTAVFTIKYLRSLGFKADNDIFAQNSWYFRNALVRANYTNLQKGISENPVFLEKFFRNLLLDEHNELKNRETHIDYAKYTGKISEETTVKIDENFGVKEKSSVEIVENFGTNEKTSVQILELIKNNPKITLQEIAEKTNRSKRAIEMQVKKLRETGVLKRVGATKNGYWEIVEEK